MKALTLTQPWASLVARGEKKIETRSWRTSYRGPLAIHAAKGLAGLAPGLSAKEQEEELVAIVQQAPFYRALGAGKVADIVAGLPRGAVVAVCILVDCHTIYESTIHAIGRHTNEYAFGNYAPGRFAWMLEKIEPLPEPIPARGSQLLWELEV